MVADATLLTRSLWIVFQPNLRRQVPESSIRGQQGLSSRLGHARDLHVDRPHHSSGTRQASGEQSCLPRVGVAERKNLVPRHEVLDLGFLLARTPGPGDSFPEFVQDRGGQVNGLSTGIDLAGLVHRLELLIPQVEDETRLEDHVRTSNARRSLRAASIAFRMAFTEVLPSIPAYSARGRRSVSRRMTSVKLSSGPLRALKRS